MQSGDLAKQTDFPPLVMNDIQTAAAAIGFDGMELGCGYRRRPTQRHEGNLTGDSQQMRPEASRDRKSVRHYFATSVTRGDATSGPWHLGLRPENHTSGGGLTAAASAGVRRAAANNRLGNRALQVLEAKQRRRGSMRLRCGFRPDATGWPHCARDPM